MSTSKNRNQVAGSVPKTVKRKALLRLLKNYAWAGIRPAARRPQSVSPGVPMSSGYPETDRCCDDAGAQQVAVETNIWRRPRANRDAATARGAFNDPRNRAKWQLDSLEPNIPCVSDDWVGAIAPGNHDGGICERDQRLWADRFSQLNDLVAWVPLVWRLPPPHRLPPILPVR